MAAFVTRSTPFIPHHHHSTTCSLFPASKLAVSSVKSQQKSIKTASNTTANSSSTANPATATTTTTGGTTPESTDWIASSLSRRFGLGAGLAWAGFLAIGVVSEQIKTRFEASQEQSNTIDVEKEEEVVLPNNIRYTETRIGGGGRPRVGDLVVIDLVGKVQGSVGDLFVDTLGGKESPKKPLALVLGSRPYTRGMCEGIEYVLKSMKGGGRRRVVIPPELGFGDKGADLGSGVGIPPGATLEYIVQVDKVSIAPA